MPEYTPTQKRILRVLSDGMCHSKEELHEKCIADELSGMSALLFHICELRKKLTPKGEDIVYRVNGNARRKGYQHVRTLRPLDE